jgi:ELWxxDGT repeat protein
VKADDVLFYIVNNTASSTTSLWKSDGTTAGSAIVKTWSNLRILYPTAVEGDLFFTLTTQSRSPAELWKSDGTAAGTEMLKSASYIENLADVNGTLFFTAAEDAVQHNDQGRAAAAIAMYGEAGHSPQAVYDRMIKYTISEDGRLHGEKYFQTVQEEYRTTRPAFRWRQIVGLARVTASAYGYDREDKNKGRAPGYEEACRLLKVTA